MRPLRPPRGGLCGLPEEASGLRVKARVKPRAKVGARAGARARKSKEKDG